MALSYILTYLEDQTSLVLNTTMFEAMLPETQLEGVQVRSTSEIADGQSGMEDDTIIISVLYKSYPTAKAMATSIFNSLKVMRGMCAAPYPFTLVGPIVKEYLGQENDQKRFVFEIRLSISHPEDFTPFTTTTTTTTTSTTSTTTTQP
jgi:hypothetical protein